MLNSRMASQKKPSEPEPGEDLLAQCEADEFEASVRAARLRAAGRIHVDAVALPTSANAETGDEIVWSEQTDVYRPRPIDAPSYVASLSLPRATRVRAGESIVLIRKAAYAVIAGHLRSDVAIELGGLLGGEALYDRGLDLFVVVIEVALPALNGTGTATTFSYTPAAWEAILPAWKQMNSEWTIVGSYHSHPGMGVFLSSVDRTTQAEIFPHDWQVAMVVDPVANTTGLFMGVSGKPCSHLLF
jgi:proteasome lid subunit RPN8/RPN11